MVKDIALDNNNDIADLSTALYFVDDSNAVRQKLKVRLQWFLGEWFLNTSLGLPYFQQILVKNPNILLIETLLKKVVLETDGVTGIGDFELIEYNPESRFFNISFTATTNSGTIQFDEGITI